MAFRTKIDFSNNRQIRQEEQTTTHLLGATEYGLPLSGLSSGPNFSSSAVTEVHENVVSTFVGNLSSTTFTFGNSIMNGTQIYLNTITDNNFNDVQVVEPHFVGLYPFTNPYVGNTGFLEYEAVEYDLTVTHFEEFAPNQFSGTAISEVVTKYTASSLDYQGNGVWLKVYGIAETDKLKINQLSTGPSIKDLGINAQGMVVEVASDERLKENVKTITNALEKVKQLRGVTYNWKDRENGGDDLRIGFIAQEVGEVVNELIFNTSDGYYGVHYGNVTALLVEAIKELLDVNEESNLITEKHVPTSSNDEYGFIGEVVCDDNYMYVKTNSGWKRTTLELF